MLFKKPMKAEDGNIAKMKFPILALPKYDGVRGLNRDAQLFARTLKRFKNKALNARFDHEQYMGLDGELCVDHTPLTFDDALCRNTTSVVNSYDKEDSVTWHCFDLLDYTTIDLPYIDRHNALTIKARDLKHVVVIPYVWINNAEEAQVIINKNAELGYEGTIFRDPQGMHKNGRATENDGGQYWRFKNFADEECIVVSLNEAMENTNEAKTNELGHTERSSHKENMIPKGMIGSLNCRSEKWGDFTVGAGELSHQERTHYWNNQDELLGKLITFKYMTTGIKDKPRFPTFKSLRCDL